MDEFEIQNLKDELNSFRQEKEKIRKIMEQVGGSRQTRQDTVINIVFISALALLFLGDISRHVFHLDVPLPSMFSIEIGVFLVSLKIIWMMHKQTKVEHFQFWILNSIEFRLNDLSKKITNIKKELKDK